MTISFAQEFLVQQVFVFLAIFARLGSMIMVFPAFSSSYVPTRVRLVFALAVAFLVMPLVLDSFPAIPETSMSAAFFVGAEALLGLTIGVIVRLVLSALQVAGTLIAFQTSLAMAQNFDPSQGVQGALVGSFLSLLGVVLIFVLDLHHMLLAAMRDSYFLFPPGKALPFTDILELGVNTVAQSFALGVKLALPFMAVGLIFYLAIGALSKLMPQVQIFFVAIPANIVLGFLILMLLISAMMMWFAEGFEATVSQFLN